MKKKVKKDEFKVEIDRLNEQLQKDMEFDRRKREVLEKELALRSNGADNMMDKLGDGLVDKKFGSLKVTKNQTKHKKVKKDEFKIRFHDYQDWPCLTVTGRDGIGYMIPFPPNTTNESISEGQIVDLVHKAKAKLGCFEERFVKNREIAYKAANPRK